MNLREIYERIELRLKALGLSANEASKRAGRPDAIRNLRRAMENGNRSGVTTSTVTALAPVLETTVAWLLDGTGEVSAPQPPPPDEPVPVNVALDEALLKQALAVTIEEAAQLPQGEASLPLMAEVLATSVVRSLKRAQAQHSAGSGSSPETGMLSSHIRSAFRGLFPADH